MRRERIEEYMKKKRKKRTVRRWKDVYQTVTIGFGCSVKSRKKAKAAL